MILFIDNYDSFVYNLARYFQRLGQTTHVVRNDAIDAAGVRRLAPRAIVLSPGPCTPQEAGCSREVVAQLWPEIPMLGVCLGHQALAAALGGRVVPAGQPMHGRTSDVWHDGRGIFRGVPQPTRVCRYHSLTVERASLPDCFEVSAWTADDAVMAIRHRQRPLAGVQFHPESILTECGYLLLANFLCVAGITAAPLLPSHQELAERPPATAALPNVPVTF